LNAFVKRTWYRAAWSRDLTDKPLHQKICGEEIAFYRTAAGEAKAIGAICPHRGSNLANGKVVKDGLQCPYHGWRFSADGKCADIPSQPDSIAIQEKACVPHYPVREQQGIVWIWPERAGTPDAEPPTYELLGERSDMGVLLAPEAVLNANFVNVVENGFDESHLCFLHERTIGVKTAIVPRQLISKDNDGLGVTARWDPEVEWGGDLLSYKGEVKPKRKLVDDVIALISYKFLSKGVPDWRLRRWSFRMGGSVAYQEFASNGDPLLLVMGSATPIDSKSTMFAVAFVSPIYRNWLGRALGNYTVNLLNSEDQLGTEGLLSMADELAHPVSVIADRPAVAFRRLYTGALRTENGDGASDAPKLTEVA
jgi:phenylpropionate dioxygenase-like ring-hydroxylating dioxygenase large terminal subunit